MIDTHTHLYLEDFPGQEGREAVERAIAAGVTKFIFPNVDTSTVAPLLQLQDTCPSTTVFAMGLHPTEVDTDWHKVLVDMENHFSHPSCVAVGEVGIDLYWDTSKRDLQMEAFRAQLRMAQKLNLPVIIHCREALDEVLECIKAEQAGEHPMVFHSFTGSPDDVRCIREVVPDAFFGINGVVTFKNAKALQAAIPEIGITKILLETDSPYLAPVPHRGKRNESAYIIEVCKKVAELLQLSPQQVEEATDTNACALFHLPPADDC